LLFDLDPAALLLCITIVDDDGTVLGCFVDVAAFAIAGTLSAVAQRITSAYTIRFILN
jgi:hypothetical protein